MSDTAKIVGDDERERNIEAHRRCVVAMEKFVVAARALGRYYDRRFTRGYVYTREMIDKAENEREVPEFNEAYRRLMRAEQHREAGDAK
jgi:hypothetical protein